MTTPPELTALRRSATRYRKAKTAADAALDELTQAIRTADAAGVPRKDVLAESPLARQTTYNALAAKP